MAAKKKTAAAKPAARPLTAHEAEIVTRDVEFSVMANMAGLVKAFPSVTFKKTGSNAGVTWFYTLTGPRIWLDKIERKYVYGAGCMGIPSWL